MTGRARGVLHVVVLRERCRYMAYGDLLSVDPPVEDVWYAEGGGPGSPAWFVLVHREGYTQEFWFADEGAAVRFAHALERA